MGKMRINSIKQYLMLNVSAVMMISLFCLAGCNKSPAPASPTPTPTTFEITNQSINTAAFNSTKTLLGINANPVIKISFSDKVDRASLSAAISYTGISPVSSTVAYSLSYQNNDSTVIISPATTLNYLNKYAFSISTLLKSSTGNSLNSRVDLSFYTSIDSTDKFTQISDSALLDLVQKQTFKYFWDFGHPVCGMALERSNGDNNVVTTGGTGFGIMAMIVAANRGFITRADAVTKLNTIKITYE